MGSQIFNIKNYFFNPYALPHILIGIIIILEGIFIFFQNKRSLTNRAYLINCFFPAVWLTGVGITLITQRKDLALFWSRTYCFFGIIFIPAAVYLFSIAWKGSLLEDSDSEESFKIYELFWRKKALILVFSISTIFYLFSVFSHNFLLDLWVYPWGFYPRGGSILLFFIAWFFFIYILALRNFILVYKKVSSPLRKKQAKLIVLAFFVAVIGAADFLPKYGVSLYLLGAFPTLVFVSLVGYCVIRYKLMDIETMLHKTVAWFFTNLILVIPFVLIIYLIYPWFSTLSNLNILFFLGFLGVVFLFFVRGIHPKIDHFFQRRRYDLEDIANQFTEDLIHLKGVLPLSRKIKDVVKSTLYAQQISLFIYDSQKDKYIAVDEADAKYSELKIESTFLQWLVRNNRIVYKDLIEIDPFYVSVKSDLNRYFDFTDSVVIVPLILGKELLGLVNLSKKTTFQKYSALDFHFLTILKNQSAIAISNSLLYDNMEDQVKKRTEELLQMQKQLIRAEKMATVGTLAGGVAHEINNPLTAILTNVQFLLDSPGSVDQESLQLMEEATKRCRTIVQKLMLYARKPSESSQMQKVNILDVIKDVIGLIRYQFKQDNITINLKAKLENYPVRGNQNEIEQVITNLILNAKDAIQKIKPQGVIGLAVSSDNGNIIVKVKDEGAGISEENLTKIFDPFFTTKDVGKGTGLGLSICQAIVQKHQGTIEVESKLNRGSVFIVILPQEGCEELR